MPSMKTKCFACKHFNYSKTAKVFKCSAFPEKIPNEILFGDFEHDRLHPKQNNTVLFEPITTNLREEKVLTQSI